MKNLSAADVAQHLGLDREFRHWLIRLEGLRRVTPMRVPEPSEALSVLTAVGVSDADASDVVAALSVLEQDAALWWLVERCHCQLTLDLLGDDEVHFEWHNLPEHLGSPGRLLWLCVFLLAVADVRQWHAEHNVPEDVSWTTLSVLGSHINQYKREHGRVGLEVTLFFSLAFRGVLFRIGRLSYIPYRLCTSAEAGPLFWYDAVAIEELGLGFRPGDPALSIHVPASAPLDPSECDASLERARDVSDHEDCATMITKSAESIRA